MWDRQKSQMTGMTRRGQAELQTMLKLVKTPQRRGAELQTWHPLPQTIQNSMKFSTNFAERRNMLKWEPASPLRNNGALKPWVKTWRFQAFRGLYQCCKCQRIYSESTVTGKYMKIYENIIRIQSIDPRIKFTNVWLKTSWIQRLVVLLASKR